jgi:hypothetical protein
MVRPILAVLALAAVHGGGCGNGCAHTGGMHHAGVVPVPGGGLHSVGSVSIPSGGLHHVGPVPFPSGGPHHIGPVPVPSASGHPVIVSTIRANPSPHLAPPPLGGSSHHQDFVSDVVDTAWDVLMSIVQTPIEIAPFAPAPFRDDVPVPCQSVADCGEGTLQQGVVCDRSARRGDIDAIGICRDACRDDRDCPSPLRCLFGLDPTDMRWGGCRED